MCGFFLSGLFLLQAVDPLDVVLSRAIGELNKLKSATVQVRRTVDDKTFQTKETVTGTAIFEQPSRLKMDVTGTTKPHAREVYLFSDDTFYWLDYRGLALRAYPLQNNAWPKANTCATALNYVQCTWFPLLLWFGSDPPEAWTEVTAALVRKRFEVDWIKRDDPHHVYLNIVPRFHADRCTFQRAQLVLSKDSFLPRQLWFETPNKNTVLWELTEIKVNPKVGPATWKKPDLPAGWTFYELPRLPEDISKPARP